ncbi:MAG TPA: GNAT family N-acetyltransferase [Clostridia bacterium]|nr:GNAT family N-acetyltransferase [Clostridia bacterium]
MIDFAKKSDIPALSELWKMCFGDTDEYIEFFMKNRFVPVKTLVKKVDEKIISMLFLLDGEVKIHGEIFSSIYIYAAGTNTEFRKKGYMEELIDWAKAIAKGKSVDFISLVPSNEQLFSYYSKFGFKESFKRKEITLSRKQLKAISVESAQSGLPCAENVLKLRNSVLSFYDSFLWDEFAINYALKEHNITQGKSVFAYKADELCGYALFHENNGITNIKELCALLGSFGHVAKLLFESTESNVFNLSLPVGSPISCDMPIFKDNAMLYPVSTGAIKNIDKIQNAYFGLSLG